MGEQMTSGITAALARFAVETSAESLPAELITAARRAVLDTLGVAVAGAREPASRIVGDYIADQHSSEECVVWGTSRRVRASGAALINGVAAHVLDFDDTHDAMFGHPSVPVLPAVVAMAERVGASGADLLAAFAIGVEVECALGTLVGSAAYDRGWHATNIYGVIGATAGAGRLAGLTCDQMAQAIGLAASHSSGIRQNFGTMTKSFHVGRAAESAIMSIELVQRGFTASSVGIEGSAGFLDVFGRNDDVDASAVLNALGNPWYLVEPGINVKLYPSCAFTHGAIDLALDLSADVASEDVDSVVVEVPYTTPQILIHHRPEDALSAKFSLEYCVAAAVVDGAVTLEHFVDDVVMRDDLQQMLRQVSYVVPEEWSDSTGAAQFGLSRMTVNLRDGTSRRGETESSRGSASKPPSQEELEAKFLSCAGSVLGEDRAAALLGVISRLEQLDSVVELTELLALPS